MKKKGSPERSDDDLRRNYGAELFRNMKPNRFARVTIAPPINLDEDVAEVFDSSEAALDPSIPDQVDAHGGAETIRA